jgi:hypothetical protein
VKLICLPARQSETRSGDVDALINVVNKPTPPTTVNNNNNNNNQNKQTTTKQQQQQQQHTFQPLATTRRRFAPTGAQRHNAIDATIGK